MPDSSSNTSFRAKVQFEFREEGEGVINLKVGDVVVVTDNSDVNWWRGYIEGNPEKEGYFPANHVNVKNQSDTVDDFIWQKFTRKLNSVITRINSMQNDLYGQKVRIEELEGLPEHMHSEPVPEVMHLGGGRKHKRKSKKSRKRTKRRKSSKRKRRR